jgi:Protein of unknown function (DUF1572)
MAPRLATSYPEDSLSLFRCYKNPADRAITQLTDEELPLKPDPESNPVAIIVKQIIVKHTVGNMQSRWPDFLTTDGEKPGCDRDAEFENPVTTREALLTSWDAGWRCLFDALEPLTDDDLGREVTIRGEEHSVMQCINRQMAHYAYHLGQIVFLARHLRSGERECPSIPRRQSAEFNRRVATGEASQRQRLVCSFMVSAARMS